MCMTNNLFLKNSFLSDMKKGEELKTRNNRLIDESKHPLFEQLHRFLNSVLPSLI